MKIAKRFVFLLIASMLLSLCAFTGAATDDLSFTVSAGAVTDGTVDITVTASNVPNEAITVFVISFGVGNSYFTMPPRNDDGEFTSGMTCTGAEYANTDGGNNIWLLPPVDPSVTTRSVTLTYSVDGNIPDGSYPVTVGIGEFYENTCYAAFCDWDSGEILSTITEATITPTTITIGSGSGYGVNLSASDESVAKGGTVNLYLDVVNASETTFNAFYATLHYDSDLVTYRGTAEISGFTVDSSTDETLKISKTGAAVTIGDTHELTLPFTANAAGSASFALNGANVDIDANAESNAPAATVTGSQVAVTITETDTNSVSITLGANTSSSGGELSQTGLTGAMTAVVVTPAAGYKLAAPTVTGSGVTATANADGSYTISGTPTAGVTVTFADATVKAPTATSSTYFTGYTLIAATIEANGYVPTYDGHAMFTVEGYDADTYYYVISGTYDAAKLGSASGAAENIAKSADVNQTGVIDINDAQFVYNIYNGTPPTANVVQRLLLADVNRDKTVTVSDCAAVVAAIP